jgi:outer membrane protein OmpA-like peptidoglycan-associated protein
VINRPAVADATVVPKPAADPPRPKCTDPHVIRVAGDPWSGYSTFRGEPKLTAQLHKSGICIDYIDAEDPKLWEQGARMAALAKGEIDLAVTTVDAFLQHGAKHKVNGQYPGTILWNIDESAGGDAIFVSKNKRSFDDLGPTDTVCYSVGTPSEHLWDFASLSFSHLENLRTDLKTDKGEDVTDAGDCWKKLQAGKVQVAVLWQPYTAQAVKAGYKKVFATGPEADDIIVDIVVANRDYARREQKTLETLAKAYFQVIAEYEKDVPAHAKLIADDCGPTCDGLGESVLAGIDFLNYEANMQLWWGKRDNPSKMPGRIERTARLLRAKHKLDEAPSADAILDDRFLVAMDTRSLTPVAPPKVVEKNDPGRIERDAEARHDESKNVGMMRLPNVKFGEGSYRLDANGKEIVRSIKDTLQSFPGLCIHIFGYTSSPGNRDVNLALSNNRAQAIANELKLIDSNAFNDVRLDVRGFGPTRVILKADGGEDEEASRRTEFTLYKCARA